MGLFLQMRMEALEQETAGNSDLENKESVELHKAEQET